MSLENKFKEIKEDIKSSLIIGSKLGVGLTFFEFGCKGSYDVSTRFYDKVVNPNFNWSSGDFLFLDYISLLTIFSTFTITGSMLLYSGLSKMRNYLKNDN